MVFSVQGGYAKYNPTTRIPKATHQTVCEYHGYGCSRVARHLRLGGAGTMDHRVGLEDLLLGRQSIVSRSMLFLVSSSVDVCVF